MSNGFIFSSTLIDLSSINYVYIES